jgi:hypothetical protein
MRLQNLTWNIARLFMALVLTVFLGAIAAAQMAGQSADSARYSEREAYFSKMRERRNDTSAVKTGWLILDGLLVEPPYTVATTDSSVTVNGLAVFTSKPEFVEESAKLTKSTATGAYAAIIKALDIFADFRDSLGVAEARDSVLSFLLAQESIDTAYTLTEQIIRYRDTIYQWEKELWLTSNPHAISTDALEHNRSKLQVYANRLIITLKEGALVIQEGKRSHSISYPHSETTFLQLREAVATISNFEERKKRIAEIIGKEEYADKIAREFR